MRAQCLALLNHYAQRASIQILTKVRNFVLATSKRLLVVLVVNTDGGVLESGGPRDNQLVVDFLRDQSFDYVDLDQALVDECRSAQTRLGYADYVRSLAWPDTSIRSAITSTRTRLRTKSWTCSIPSRRPTSDAETANWTRRTSSTLGHGPKQHKLRLLVSHRPRLPMKARARQ
jgi:hypothetical protein